MPGKGLLFTFCIALLLGFSFEKKTSPGLHFLTVLNNCDKEKLEKITSPDFEIKRTFTSFTTTREDFLGHYLETNKILNAKFLVLKTLQSNNPEKYLVKDQSDYFDLLKMQSPEWILTLKIDEDQKVASMLIDTTESYTLFQEESVVKEKAFRDWMQEKYPEESTDFMENPEHFMKRLREYSKTK